MNIQGEKNPKNWGKNTRVGPILNLGLVCLKHSFLIKIVCINTLQTRAMFGWKAQADITGAEPQFSVRYAGSTETFTATGPGCTAIPVQRVWDNAPEERHMRRCELLVSPAGLMLLDADRPTDGRYRKCIIV